MKKLMTCFLTIMAVALFTPTWANSDNSAQDAETETVVLYVDINTDDAEKLADLMLGVGLKKAEAIIRFREENGPFMAIDDLLNVPGIGPATLEKNRAIIRLNDLN